jgi:hypothetical protein
LPAFNSIEIYGLCSAGGVTRECQLSLPGNRIDQTGFADVASPQKSDLGQSVGGELLRMIGA